MSTALSVRKSRPRVRSDLRWTYDTVIFLLAAMPFLLCKYIPLNDLYNHAARQSILHDLPNSATLKAYYVVHLAFVPNLAMDVVVQALALVLPVDVAVRLFCVSVVLTLLLGTRALNMALCGRGAVAYGFAPFLIYGGPLFFGFMNFCLGVGIALLGMALYIRRRRMSPIRQWYAMTPVFFALILCHAGAYVLCALAIGAYELAEAVRRSTLRLSVLHIINRAGAAVCFVAPAGLSYWLASPSGIEAYSTRFGSLRDKLEGLGAITMFSEPLIEVPLLAVCIGLSAVALTTHRLQISMTSVIMILLCGAMFLIAPRTTAGTGYIDYRIPWAAAFFVLAGLSGMSRSARWLAPMLGVLVVTRVAVVIVQWVLWSPRLASVVEALDTLPPGIRLMEVAGRPPSVSTARQPPLQHIAAYAVAHRQALWLGMFASIPGQILYFQPQYFNGWASVQFSSVLAAGVSDYDYLAVTFPEYADISADHRLRCVAEGYHFRLYRHEAAEVDTYGRQCPSEAALPNTSTRTH